MLCRVIFSLRESLINLGAHFLISGGAQSKMAEAYTGLCGTRSANHKTWEDLGSVTCII